MKKLRKPHLCNRGIPLICTNLSPWLPIEFEVVFPCTPMYLLGILHSNMTDSKIYCDRGDEGFRNSCCHRKVLPCLVQQYGSKMLM